MGYEKWHSPSLQRDMELKIYGHGGKPVLVFPSGGGRFYEYEDFGMIEACRPFLEQGRIQIFTIDSVDQESWHNKTASPADRVRRHEQYEKYILDEVLPLIRSVNRSGQPLLATGCSMGGYHSANFLFRHPDIFDSVIALSGLYGPEFVFGQRWDESFYFHFPLAYLPGLKDPRILELLRRSKIILCVGRGDWESCDQYDCIHDTQAMQKVLEAKGIPCWVDLWGHDVRHDWEWWRKQMPYFLERIL